MADGQTEIDVMIAEAAVDYEYFRKEEGRVLIRRSRPTGSVQRLVNGEWVPRRSRKIGYQAWKPIDSDRLRAHVRRYLVDDLSSAEITWQNPVLRLTRGPLWRVVLPPLKGGADRKVKSKTANRSRDAYEHALRKVRGDDLVQLEAQAKTGLEQQRERTAGIEQRANFFLGAAGLTTTLVLTNAGFLIGDDKLEGTWLTLAVVVLLLSSLFALVAGVRALEAVMITFVRTPPNAVSRVVKRGREKRGDDLRRAYVAALLVGQARTGTIGDWKVSRMKQARRWFLGVICGGVALTACVLAGAVIWPPS